MVMSEGTTEPNVTAGASNVTLAYPKANALFYGSVKDNLGNPFVGLDVEAYDNNDLYGDGYTDTNGDYVIGVLGDVSNESWWPGVSSDNWPTNYIFSKPDYEFKQRHEHQRQRSSADQLHGSFSPQIPSPVIFKTALAIPSRGLACRPAGSLTAWNTTLDLWNPMAKAIIRLMWPMGIGRSGSTAMAAMLTLWTAFSALVIMCRRTGKTSRSATTSPQSISLSNSLAVSHSTTQPTMGPSPSEATLVLAVPFPSPARSMACRSPALGAGHSQARP